MEVQQPILERENGHHQHPDKTDPYSGGEGMTYPVVPQRLVGSPSQARPATRLFHIHVLYPRLVVFCLTTPGSRPSPQIAARSPRHARMPPISPLPPAKRNCSAVPARADTSASQLHSTQPVRGLLHDPALLAPFSYSPPATADSLQERPVVDRRRFLAGTSACSSPRRSAPRHSKPEGYTGSASCAPGNRPGRFVEAFQQGLRARGTSVHGREFRGTSSS